MSFFKKIANFAREMNATVDEGMDRYQREYENEKKREEQKREKANNLGCCYYCLECWRGYKDYTGYCSLHDLDLIDDDYMKEHVCSQFEPTNSFLSSLD